MSLNFQISGTDYIQYKTDLKKMIDYSLKFIRAGQLLIVYNYIHKTKKYVVPVVYIPHSIDYSGSQSNNFTKVIVHREKMDGIDVHCNTQYLLNSDSANFVKFIITSAIVLESDIQEFKKSLDTISSIDVIPPLTKRDFYKLGYNGNFKTGQSFSKHYPDAVSDKNNTLSIKYNSGTDIVDNDDEKYLSEVNKILINDGVYQFPLNDTLGSDSIELRYQNYPIKLKKITLRRYLRRSIGSDIYIELVSSDQHVDNFIIETIHKR